MANKLNEKLHHPALLRSWALGVQMFFLRLLLPLFVGNVMRPITDKAKVSREKLAWLCDCTLRSSASPSPSPLGACMAGLWWASATFATAEAGQGRRHPLSPFQLYGILTIVMIFLVALGFCLTTAHEEGRGACPHHRQGGGRRIPPPCCPVSLTTSPKEGFKSPTSFCTSDPRSDRYRRDHRHLCHGSAKTLEAFVLASSIRPSCC